MNITSQIMDAVTRINRRAEQLRADLALSDIWVMNGGGSDEATYYVNPPRAEAGGYLVVTFTFSTGCADVALFSNEEEWNFPLAEWSFPIYQAAITFCETFMRQLDYIAQKSDGGEV